ncbi:MAG: IS256 family transposase [Chloroflexota bacterium]|nr:IS256 family transposase [Chloroflexota bacterium]
MADKKPHASSSSVLPSVERIQQELAQATSIDDFFGKEGIFARLFAGTLEQMLEAELTAHLGYEPYAASGRNSGNNRNGKRNRNLRTSTGDVTIQVPRDRNGDFQPALLDKYQTSTNELEEKIIALYAKGVSTRDIQETLHELYGVEVSAQTISTVTDKVWSLVEAWQSRPLATVYPIVYLDAIHLKLRRDGKVLNTAVYIVLGVDLEGQRDVLGQWVGDGAEGANFWLSVVTDLQARGVEDIFIACIDGLSGFKDAIQAVFPQTQIQRCIIHQVRQSLSYVSWKDRKAFVADLKRIYQAPTREAAELKLLELGERWGDTYAVAVRSWEKHWEDLGTMFDYPAEIRRLIYTTNTVEGYNRQVRKVTKTKGALPSADAARKLLYLATRYITKTWTMPVYNWAKIRNQLAIRFEGRFPV